MPLTKKGEKIMGAMEEEYGAKKAKKVFYASRNKGTIKGVERGVKTKPKGKKKFNAGGFERARRTYFGLGKKA